MHACLVSVFASIRITSLVHDMSEKERLGTQKIVLGPHGNMLGTHKLVLKLHTDALWTHGTVFE